MSSTFTTNSKYGHSQIRYMEMTHIIYDGKNSTYKLSDPSHASLRP